MGHRKKVGKIVGRNIYSTVRISLTFSREKLHSCFKAFKSRCLFLTKNLSLQFLLKSVTVFEIQF